MLKSHYYSIASKFCIFVKFLRLTWCGYKKIGLLKLAVNWSCVFILMLKGNMQINILLRTQIYQALTCWNVKQYLMKCIMMIEYDYFPDIIIIILGLLLLQKYIISLTCVPCFFIATGLGTHIIYCTQYSW